MDLVQEFSGMDYGDYGWAFLPQTESPHLMSIRTRKTDTPSKDLRA